MPPPSDLAAFYLSLLPEPFYVMQLDLGTPIPDKLLNQLTSSATGAPLLSITRTKEEISIVGEYNPSSDIPIELANWRCIKIAGPMAFGVTGVLCDFTTPLKKAEIPVFAVSTWNTDYVLVPDEFATKAVYVLEQDGWVFGE